MISNSGKIHERAMEDSEDDSDEVPDEMDDMDETEGRISVGP